MGFLDRIVSAAGEMMRAPGPAAGNSPAGNNQPAQAAPTGTENSVLSGLVDLFKTGGTQNILNGFTRQGLGGIIGSWIGTGANSPISPEQIRNGLGSDAIRRLAQRAGISEERVMEQLRTLLPGVIDRATPDGTIEGVDAPAASPESGEGPVNQGGS